MRLSIDAADLSEAASLAASVAKGHAALSCLLLSVTDGGLSITGGDDDTFVKVPAGGTALDTGAIATPAKVFSAAVKQLRGDVLLTLDDDGFLGVETMTSRLTLPSIPADEYPKYAPTKGDPVDLGPFWDGLQHITYVTDNPSHANPILRSVLFWPEGRAQTYSGTRLAYCPAPEGLSGPVLTSSVRHAGKLLGGEITLTLEDQRSATFAAGGLEVWCRIPSADYKPLPKIETPHHITCKRAEMQEALGLVEVVRETPLAGIRIDVENGQILMRANTVDVGRVIAMVGCEGELPYATGLTVAHTRQALAELSGEEVTFEFSAKPNTPIIIREDGVEHYLNPNVAAVKNNAVDEES